MCAQCQAVSRHFDTPDTPDTPDTRHLRHLRHHPRHPRHARHPAESKMGRTCLTAGPVSWDRWTCVLGPLDLCPGTAGPVSWDRCTCVLGPAGPTCVSTLP